MAVIVKYFIVRNGIELDQAFSDKKEAEAYDKMMDAADELENLIRNSGIEIDLDNKTIREIAVVLAKSGPQVTQILRNVRPFTPAKPSGKPSSSTDTEKDTPPPERPKRKSK